MKSISMVFAKIVKKMKIDKKICFFIIGKKTKPKIFEKRQK